MIAWVGLVARLVVGGVWLVAGALKVTHPEDSVRAVAAFRLLPDVVETPVGYGLPVLEVCTGLLLVLGLTTRFAAVISALLLTAFIIGIASAWARGLRIECGCFGGGGQTSADVGRAYALDLARDLGLLLLSFLVAWRPITRLSTDAAIHSRGALTQ